jgi:hypothetical protein
MGERTMLLRYSLGFGLCSGDLLIMGAGAALVALVVFVY